jgi:hypothetical protein
MDKRKKLEKVSDYRAVLKKSRRLYRRDVFPSSKKEKKYMIENDRGHWVHFGSMGYQDYTRHKDKTRRKSYLARASHIHGKWKQNKFSPNNLAISLLW